MFLLAKLLRREGVRIAIEEIQRLPWTYVRAPLGPNSKSGYDLRIARHFDTGCWAAGRGGTKSSVDLDETRHRFRPT